MYGDKSTREDRLKIPKATPQKLREYFIGMLVAPLILVFLVALLIVI